MSRFALIALSLTLLPAAARADGDAALGKTLFSRCAGCHTVTAQNKVGPGLAGVFGRRAASVAGFRYSKALSATDIVWDDATLEQFLAAPAKMVPGTSMAVSVPKSEDRTNLIAYLKTLGAGVTP
ncbi:cytochrome c [Ancylobacter sp. 3268]|uniref:c-type cytochrome n=1 Tax=Ancylobacter sp. 3268 TaxID=2817752 RepID=UPI002856A5E1|nr:c-type cytochrome [Ancylobacter sp. 3268]MDR6951519.1 cytochrome c [Ancylobacter sp. 3268]